MNGLIIDQEWQHLLYDNRIYYEPTNGYYRVKNIGEGKRYVYLHRLVIGAKRGEIVDHINGNKHDNRRSNLRLVSYKLNNYNRHVKNPLGRGISYDKWGSRYRAHISHNGETIRLGSFSSVNDAKIAYNKKAFEIYGVDAFQHAT